MEILSDLETNISDLEGMLTVDANYIQRNIRSIGAVIEQMQVASPYHDSLAHHFTNTISYPDVVLKTSGYESLASIGMDLITDQRLRSAIGKYYTLGIPKFALAHRELRDDFYNYLLGYMRTDFYFQQDGTNELVPKNYEDLKIKGEYLQSLKLYHSVYVNFESAVKSTLEESLILKKGIETYLEPSDL